jgi:acetolactate synthase-1/2/3 large subunit
VVSSSQISLPKSENNQQSPVSNSSVPSPKRASGGFALIDSLIRHGVEHIFGYPGGAILPIYDDLYKIEAGGTVKHILVRHEQGASHAADGYARDTGKV